MSKTTKQLIAISIIPQYFIVKWLAQYPDIIETYYSNGFYQYSSKLFRYVFGFFLFQLVTYYIYSQLFMVLDGLLKTESAL